MYTNFVIPEKKANLLQTSVSGDYRVNNVTGTKELPSELKRARVALRDEGPEFIVDTFDIYYSVLHHGESLAMDVIYKAHEDLHKATSELNKAIGFLLEDKDSLNDEVRTKYLNVIKMLVYIYTQIAILVEQRIIAKNEQQLTKNRKKSSKDNDDSTMDKRSVLLLLNNIIQREISLFWDPPVVEENFISLISGICYELLQNPSIKSEKEEISEIFTIFGHLLKVYNHGTTFVVRITQLIKLHEHLTHCLPKGIQQIVQDFNCKGLLHELIQELTEWQTDEKQADNQGARYCASVLSSLAALMPDLILPEVMSLNTYLYYEPPSLRNSVLTVMVEVILNNLTGHDLTEEQREFRDSLLDILIEHIDDVSVLVRSKVLQQWARLQKETAVPLKYQHRVLEKIVEHLFDKGAIARKNAANCISVFLSYNAYSANLSLSSMQKELADKETAFNSLKEQLKDPKMEKLLELQSLWNTKIDKLKAVVEQELEKGKENEGEAQINRIPLEEATEIGRMYLMEDKFKEAFLLCKSCLQDTEFLKKFQENNEASDDVNLYLSILHSVFFDISGIVQQVQNQQFLNNVSQEDYKRFETLEKEVEFFQHCVGFLKLIDEAIDKMVELLETTSMSDMQEATAFFIAAYHFNIDRASVGVLALLKLMQRNEQERKDAVVDAFKTIYLQTDATNMADHCVIIVNRLIKLVKTVPINNVDDVQDIIADWCAKGILDNAVIDMLWQYVTLRVSVTENDSCAAIEILRMASKGRKTIISRNIDLVTNIGFGERGKSDMLLLGASCRLLSVAHEKVDLNGKNPPFKIKPEDKCFSDLVGILTEQFFRPVPFYHKGMYGAVEFIYKMCSRPEAVCETFLNAVISKLHKMQNETPDERLPNYVIIRVCQMCGYVALKHLEFMDHTVYKELKRRDNIREERVKGKQVNKEQKKKKGRKSTANTATEASLLNVTADEMTLEGAQAEDRDADFILDVLENHTVTGTGGLAKLAPMLVNICERSDIYKGKELRGAAVTALMRYMLVSSIFCAEHIRLIFTIFEKTEYHEVKTNILVHISDWLSRYPNVVEPWTPRIFQSLNDQLLSTRLATFFILSNLILRDMIRAHSHIPEMALCLADPSPELRAMCKTFFVKLGHKENNLYNALPDIFTHLINKEDIANDDLQGIMKLLFDLIENARHMENLVDRFCSKFKLTEDLRHQRNISYCLTLIKYNEKALKKLIDNFPSYKDLLHDEDIYANIRTVMQNCSKQQGGKADLKNIVTELEELVKSVFELNEDGQMPPPRAPPKSARKPRAKKKAAGGRKQRSKDDEDEEFDDSNFEGETSTVRKSARKKKPSVVLSDSD